MELGAVGSILKSSGTTIIANSWHLEASGDQYAKSSPESKTGHSERNIDFGWSTTSSVAMNLHQAYVNAMQCALPEAAIVFEKVHIAGLAGEAVNQVCRQENKELAAEGDDRLKVTRYDWLRKATAAHH